MEDEWPSLVCPNIAPTDTADPVRDSGTLPRGEGSSWWLRATGPGPTGPKGFPRIGGRRQAQAETAGIRPTADAAHQGEVLDLDSSRLALMVGEACLVPRFQNPEP